MDPERQRRETRQVPDALRKLLVERNGVSEAGAARMRRAGEEAVVRRMPHATENGEVVARILQQFQVGRQRVAASAAGGQEMLRQRAEVVADAKDNGADCRRA